MFNRTYGVEIEAILPYGISREDLALALTNAGVQASDEYLNHGVKHHWKVTTDGSLRGMGAGSGMEIVSPILRGPEGFQQIEKVCKVLKEKGATVNHSCGLHIHVDVRRPQEMDLDALKRLALLYAQNEAIIDSVMPQSRRESKNAYCKSIRRRMRAIEEAQSISMLSDAVSKKKYVKLNYKTIWRQGTVEFRHHSATVEAYKIIKWASACLRMVKVAADGDVAESITVERIDREVRAVRSGSKTAIIHALLTRPEGCTTREVLEATGWRQVSVQGVGHNLGLTIRQVRERENGRKVIRYFGERTNRPVSLPTAAPQVPARKKFRTIEQFANYLGMTEDEKSFWEKRQMLFSREGQSEAA